MFTTALEGGSQETAGNVRRAAQFMARGGKFGLPDTMIIQGWASDKMERPGFYRLCFVEYKVGRGKLSTRQEGVHTALIRCQVPVFVARSIPDVLYALINSAFMLHDNAENLCREYQERLLASDRKAAA